MPVPAGANYIQSDLECSVVRTSNIFRNSELAQRAASYLIYSCSPILVYIVNVALTVSPSGSLKSGILRSLSWSHQLKAIFAEPTGREVRHMVMVKDSEESHTQLSR